MLDQIHTVLGFDFGTKKTGVATGQRITATAAPLAPIAMRDGIPDWQIIERLLNQWQPHAVLVGLPLNMDDSESDICHLARKFARRIEGRFKVKVLMVDERLTSRAARELLIEISDRRKGKLPSLDSTAAVLMVEGWLAQPDSGLAP